MQHLLYTTDPDVLFSGFSPDYEDNARQQMIECGYEEAELTESCVRGWIDEELRIHADEFHYELRHADDPCRWLVIADLGLWTGRHDGGRVFYRLTEAVSACLDGMNDATIVEDHHGNVTIHGYHHDGHNVYHLYRLSNLGEDWYICNEASHTWREICEFLDRPAYRRAARLRKLFGYC